MLYAFNFLVWYFVLYNCYIQKIYTLQFSMHGLSYHSFDEKCMIRNISDALLVVGGQIHKINEREIDKKQFYVLLVN